MKLFLTEGCLERDIYLKKKILERNKTINNNY